MHLHRRCPLQIITNDVIYPRGLNSCGGQVRLWLSQKRAEVLLPTQLVIEVASGATGTHHDLCSLHSTLSDISGKHDICHLLLPFPVCCNQLAWVANKMTGTEEKKLGVLDGGIFELQPSWLTAWVSIFMSQ